MAFQSIKTKIVAWVGICLLANCAGIIIYSALSVRGALYSNAEIITVETAKQYAEGVANAMEAPMISARTLSQLLSATKGKNPFRWDRDNVISMLKMLLEKNPEMAGVYTAWEPDAFDSLDSLYANSDAHDQTGRFIPYINRNDEGKTALEPLLDYDREGPGDYYQLPKKLKQECIIEPLMYPIQGKEVLMTSLVVPILSEGKFYGIAGVDITLDRIQQWTEKSARTEFGVFILSNKGVIAGASGHPELLGKSVSLLYEGFESRGLLEKIQKGQLVREFQADHLHIGVPIQIGKTATPWSVMIRVPNRVIQAEGNRIMRNQILIGSLLTCLALILIGFLAKGIALPIHKAVQFAKSVAEGDFTADMETRHKDETGMLVRAMKDMANSLKAKTKLAERIAQGDLSAEVAAASAQDMLGKALQDMLGNLKIRAEVAEERVRFAAAVAEGNLTATLGRDSERDVLGEALKNMAANLIAIIREIQEHASMLGGAAEEMTAIAAQLSGNADSMNNQSTDAAAAAEQVSTTIRTMSAGAEEISAVINSISAASGQISMNMNAIAVSVEEMAASIDNIEKTSRKGSEIAEKAITLSEHTGLAMKTLADTAKEIGEITEVIRRIADQTNMLALNATIEAASAGDAGKGFAVVANEIKELANQSGKAAESVARQIRGVQSSTDTAVAEIRDVMAIIADIHESVKIINLAVGEQAKNTAEISKNLQQSARGAADLSKSMVEATNGVMEVSRNTHEAATATNEISSRIQNVSQTAGEVSSYAKQVSLSANDISGIAAKLNTMTAQFKTKA